MTDDEILAIMKRSIARSRIGFSGQYYPREIEAQIERVAKRMLMNLRHTGIIPGRPSAS